MKKLIFLGFIACANITYSMQQTLSQLVSESTCESMIAAYVSQQRALEQTLNEAWETFNNHPDKKARLTTGINSLIEGLFAAATDNDGLLNNELFELACNALAATFEQDKRMEKIWANVAKQPNHENLKNNVEDLRSQLRRTILETSSDWTPDTALKDSDDESDNNLDEELLSASVAGLQASLELASETYLWTEVRKKIKTEFPNVYQRFFPLGSSLRVIDLSQMPQQSSRNSINRTSMTRRTA